MAGSGNLPPAIKPGAAAQRAINMQDFQRNRGYFRVPMLPTPSNFFGPEGPADKSGLARDMRYQRLLTAIQLDYPNKVMAATTQVFDLIHLGEKYRDIDNNVVITNEVLEAVCVSVGIPKETCTRIHDDDVKNALKTTTKEALEKGAFGAPTIIVSKINSSKEDEQIYFGSDRFEQLCCTHDFPWVGPCPDHPTAKI